MEQDDPEQRISDLERRLAEQRRAADPPPPGPGASGRRPTVPNEPIRCLMYEYRRGWKGLRRRLAIDIDEEAIRVSMIDPKKTSPLASASHAQVTATPAAFTAGKEDPGRTQPVLIVRVPGSAPLTIGCGALAAGWWNWPPSRLRFWWRGKVPWVKTPTYATSAAEWLTLVETFGLAPYLEDEASAGPDRDARQWNPSTQDLTAAAETGRDRRSVMGWIFTIVFAVFALPSLFLGSVQVYQYLSGTPTTATVTHCSGGNGVDCTGTWSIGGVAHTGPIEQGFGKYPVGSSLDVRVSGHTARTATSCLMGWFLGAIFLAISIIMFFLTRSRTGTLVGKR